MGERDARPLESYQTSGGQGGRHGAAPGADHGGTSDTTRKDEARPALDAARVEAILFDLDNTLVDFLRVKRLASNACARAMIAAGADFGEAPDDAAEMLFHHYLEHGIESDDAFQSFLQRYMRNKLAFSQNQQDKVLAAGINAYLRTKDTLLTPYPGVPRSLMSLIRRGYRLGVLTDAPRLKAWQRLWAVGLADCFEVVVTRTDTGTEKPHQRGFATALDALGVKPHQAAMVGDWPERDVVGGNRAGLYTVLARYGRDGHTDIPPPPVADTQASDVSTPRAEIAAFSELLALFPGRDGPAPRRR